MRTRLQHLRQVERIINYMEGEIRYKHSLIGEACINVSNKFGQPFKGWLNDLGERVCQCGEEAEYEDFYSIWCGSMDYLKAITMLNSTDIIQLENVGKALGYLDIRSQEMNLALEKELIHENVMNIERELAGRMKNVIILCFLGGVMAVIILL